MTSIYQISTFAEYIERNGKEYLKSCQRMWWSSYAAQLVVWEKSDRAQKWLYSFWMLYREDGSRR